VKERFCKVLSSLAFAYALIMFGLFFDYLMNSGYGVGKAFGRMDLHEWFVLASPAIVPTLLYIWTDDPRIPPWRRSKEFEE